MLHKNLKFLRNSQRLTQEKWGALFGVTRGMVDSYERNAATPSPTFLAKVSNYYEISLENLLQKDFAKNPTLIFSPPQKESNSSALLEAKEEMIHQLREENKFLRELLKSKE